MAAQVDEPTIWFLYLYSKNTGFKIGKQSIQDGTHSDILGLVILLQEYLRAMSATIGTWYQVLGCLLPECGCGTCLLLLFVCWVGGPPGGKESGLPSISLLNLTMRKLG